MLDLIIKSMAHVLLKVNFTKGYLKNSKIIEIADKISNKTNETFDAQNLLVLPGCMDTQVHFREPGSTDAEDLHTGSRAAVVGGITSVFEMPNTNPPTTSAKEFKNKLNLAKNRMFCNYAFYFGATPDNSEELANLKSLRDVVG